ncbi:MAG: cold shock domain-containing protein [Granulosicoccus sp.]
MTDRKEGTVKWFDNAKGYGFIVSPEGDDVFVHYRVIEGEGYRSLAEGQKVEFIATQGEKGWQASEVFTDALTAE